VLDAWCTAQEPTTNIVRIKPHRGPKRRSRKPRPDQKVDERRQRVRALKPRVRERGSSYLGAKRAATN